MRFVPEGHLYHRYARLQQPLIAAGAVEVTSPQGRFAEEAAALDGRSLTTVEAAGKNLLYHFEADEPSTVHVHLGMQGIFLQGDGSQAPKPQVRLRLAGAGQSWDLIAPSTCALITSEEAQVLRGRLGPDPLDPDADAERAITNLAAAGSTAIGTALLDQSVVAGVGNVFRAEVLVLVGIHPSTPSDRIDDAARRELWSTLVDLMGEAEAAGEIAPNRVYKQDACAQCGTHVETAKIGGRTSYACPTCQAVAA